MALTTAMARDLAQLGVSDAVIGKLVQTPPGHATWLTPSDLTSMGRDRRRHYGLERFD